jgi:hypothetical protein
MTTEQNKSPPTHTPLETQLLETLEALMKRLDSHFGNVDASWDWKEPEQARAAIAKARGQQ